MCSLLCGLWRTSLTCGHHQSHSPCKGYRPRITVPHSRLSWAIRVMSLHEWPLAFISSSKFLLHVVRGLPLLRLPWGFHCKDCLVMLFLGFLVVLYVYFLLASGTITLTVCVVRFNCIVWYLYKRQLPLLSPYLLQITQWSVMKFAGIWSVKFSAPTRYKKVERKVMDLG